jgi:hypothetical protein
MSKKVKSKDLVALVEQALLKVRFDTHYERAKMEGITKMSMPSFRIMISDELLSECRKLFKTLLDED